MNQRCCRKLACNRATPHTPYPASVRCSPPYMHMPAPDAAFASSVCPFSCTLVAGRRPRLVRPAVRRRRRLRPRCRPAVSGGPKRLLAPGGVRAWPLARAVCNASAPGLGCRSTAAVMGTCSPAAVAVAGTRSLPAPPLWVKPPAASAALPQSSPTATLLTPASVYSSVAALRRAALVLWACHARPAAPLPVPCDPVWRPR